MPQKVLNASDIGTLDLFATAPSFKISGMKKHYSFCGLFLTVIVGAFIIWSLVLTSGDLIHKTNPSLVASELPGSAFNETFILSPGTFAARVGLYDITQGLASVNRRIYRVRATLTNMAAKTPMKIFTYLDLEVCQSQVNHTPGYLFWCIKGNQSNITNMFVNQKTFIQIDFLRCVNSSTDPNSPLNTCATLTEIDARLKASMAQLEYLSWAVDPSDYQQPLKSYYTTEQQGVMLSQYKTVKVYMKKVNFVSDNGWLTQDTVTQSVIQPDTTELDSLESSSTNSPFFTFTFYSSGNVASYSRKYLKLQDILAQVSGLAGTFILIVGVLGRPYDEFKMYEKLINSMYDIKIKKKSGKRRFSRLKQMPTESSCKTQENLDTRLDTRLQTFTQECLMTKRLSYMEPHLSTLEDKVMITKQRSNELPTASTKPFRILDLTPPDKIKDAQKSGRGTFRLKSIKIGDSDSDKSDKEEGRKGSEEMDEMKEIELGKLGHDNTTEPHEVDTNSVLTRLDSQIQGERFLSPLRMSTGKEIRLERPKKIDVPEMSVHKEDSEEEEEREGKEKDDVEIEIVMQGWENSSPTTGPVLQQQNTLKQPSSGNIETEGNLFRQTTTQTNETYSVRYKQSEDHGQQLNIGYLEWLFSFLKRTNKMKIFDRGMEELQKQMDIITLVNKLGEIDKLKACMLSKEQRVLFESLRKPRLFVNWNETKRKSEAMEVNTWLEGHDATKAKAYEAYRTLKSQQTQSVLDWKLTSLFEKDEVIGETKNATGI